MESRFERHALLPDWKQTALTQATVVIVGIGALGNEVARLLAMSGVGRLILCDHDRISLSNLSRCVLFRELDIGDLKVEVAARALQSLAPQTSVNIRPLTLIHGIGLAELRDASLVMSCLDSQTARLQLAGRCNLVKAPYIDGGTALWGGEIRPFLSPERACYGCTLSTKERSVSDVPWSCTDVIDEIPLGSTASISSLIASWMSILAIRFLMGLSYSSDFLHIEGIKGITRNIQPQRDPTCPLHYPIEQVTPITVSCQDSIRRLRNVLGTDRVPLVWEAVQEQVECGHCGFKEIRWGLPQVARCPQCEQVLTLHTTLELANAPDELKLSELGIPPREILAIRSSTGMEWIELQATS